MNYEKTLVLNIYSGPGAFKSATAAGVFTLLKAHGIDCEMVYEFAKDLVWEGSVTNFNDQTFILGNQHHRLWRLDKKVEVIILDSPILFSIVYKPDTLGKEFIDNVLSIYNMYNNINIFLKRDLNTPFDNNGRNHNLKESIELDNEIKKVLKNYNIPFTKLNAGIDSINNVTSILLGYFNKKLKYSIY